MPKKQPVTKTTAITKKTVVTIILLFLGFIIPFVGLIGLLLMWSWTTWKIWIKIIITLPSVLIIIFLFTYVFIARPFQFSGDSMTPTFKNGEYVLTSLIAVRTFGIQRGDVIVFISPPTPSKDFMKRVIALPGDSIELKDGYVFLNGTKLDESTYLSSDVRTYGGTFLKDGQPFTIPADNYFVLGDNRPFSSDSREWGLVPHKYIISKVTFCYWNCK